MKLKNEHIFKLNTIFILKWEHVHSQSLNIHEILFITCPSYALCILHPLRSLQLKRKREKKEENNIKQKHKKVGIKSHLFLGHQKGGKLNYEALSCREHLSFCFI